MSVLIFGPFMTLWIHCHLDTWSIIIIGQLDKFLNLELSLFHPDILLCCTNATYSVSAVCHNCLAFFALPWYLSTSNVKQITPGSSSISNVTCPIGIRVTNGYTSLISLSYNFMLGSTFKYFANDPTRNAMSSLVHVAKYTNFQWVTDKRLLILGFITH